MYNTIAVQ